MNDFQAWVSGNVATPVRHRVAASGTHVADFRLASSRRWTGRDGQGRESTSFLTVRCFGPLADNVASSLDVGTPVLVSGRVEVDESLREGQRHRDMVVLATAIGPNLAQGTAAFRKTVSAAREGRAGPRPEQPRTSSPAA